MPFQNIRKHNKLIHMKISKKSLLIYLLFMFFEWRKMKNPNQNDNVDSTEYYLFSTAVSNVRIER